MGRPDYPEHPGDLREEWVPWGSYPSAASSSSTSAGPDHPQSVEQAQRPHLAVAGARRKSQELLDIMNAFRGARLEVIAPVGRRQERVLGSWGSGGIPSAEGEMTIWVRDNPTSDITGQGSHESGEEMGGG